MKDQYVLYENINKRNEITVMNNETQLYGVVLAGGSGSRLWPLSREMYPKQLLKLNNENTLFQSTFMRLSNIIPPSNIITVTNVKHSSDIKLQLNQLKHKNEDFKVIVEPVGRNTAPAICLSVLYIIKQLNDNDSDPIILVAPSDHSVNAVNKFTEALHDGIKLAESGNIVTFGIKPTKPDTGYGYIKTSKSGAILKLETNALKVEEFKEKPDLETAEEYLKTGAYFWNAGIFMFKASVMLNELKLNAPDIYEKLANSEIFDSGVTVSFDDYSKLPDISIDYAVMEKSRNIALIPIDCGWNDMGSWQAIYDTAQKDDKNNFKVGNVVDVDSQDCLIFGTSKLVSTIGLKNIVIVETEDAILACDKDRTQDVKKVFDHLKGNNNMACMVHNTVYRPWGYYTVVQNGENYKIKIINVNPKAKLSLQMHYHRSEHWVVLSGTAQVTRGEEDVYLKAGDSIDIPVTVKHSLQNPGVIDLKIIEVQNGSYLEEDDIVRFEDIYGRV